MGELRMMGVISKSNPIDVHVGRRLRRLRQSKDLTQEQLGEFVSVSYQQIQKYETGANRISASRLYLVARQLGVAPGYFFEGLDDAADAAASPRAGNGASAAEAARAR